MLSDEELREWALEREAGFARAAAKEQGLRQLVLQRTQGGLWHTTHPERFDDILCTGAILPEPAIPDSERWANNGPEHYPYVRTLGGVSLFDFDGFDPRTYHDHYCATWEHFVPYRSDWGSAIWVEIDRDKVAPPEFLSGRELLKRWKAEGGPMGNLLMPEIEAAFLGPLPVAAFKGAFRIGEGEVELREIVIPT